MVSNFLSGPGENLNHINIFLNEDGDVANIGFQLSELREYAPYLVGVPAKETPRIAQRVCGTCAEAHRMAATKALDAMFDVIPTSAVHKIRELLYMPFFIKDHATRFYAQGGADFLRKTAVSTPPTINDIVQQLDTTLGKQVTACQQRNHKLIQIVTGRKVHPAVGYPGGWDRPITPEAQTLFIQAARENIEFAQFCLQQFKEIVIHNPKYLKRLFAKTHYQPMYYMGLVDQHNHVNFYNGKVRIVAPNGFEIARYDEFTYSQQIASAILPGTHIAYPYLRKVGWHGLESGINSGIYCATPLARLNVADGMATPLAQSEYEQLYSMWGNPTVIHHQLATHWARLIEMLYAAERMLELAHDPEITKPDTRICVYGMPTEGIGIVESPRGTVTHHYKANEQGIIHFARLITGTSNNYAALSISLKKAAGMFIKKGTLQKNKNLRRLKMAMRTYDPYFAYATNTSTRNMPLAITVYDAAGTITTQLIQ